MILNLVLIFAVALGSYSAVVTRVVDGDTVNGVVTIWIDQRVTTSIRVRGIDTPELKGACDSERALAQMAKSQVENLLPAGSTITISNIGPDAYQGRIDADVTMADGRKLADVLIGEGLARAYDGKTKRRGWCPR